MTDAPTELDTGETGDSATRARRAAVHAAVLRYWKKHPQASDTSAGIREWWLLEEGVNEIDSVVEAALEEMVDQQLIRRIRLRDDTVIYICFEGSRFEETNLDSDDGNDA